METDDSVQVKELPDSNGEIARVKPYRKMTEGSVKGHGALAFVPGVGDPGVSGPPNGGVTVITRAPGSITSPAARRKVGMDGHSRS